MILQELIDSIEQLSVEDQEQLFDLIRKRRIEVRRTEIATRAKEVLQAVELGTAKRGSFEEIKAYLLESDDDA